jgi:transcriptional regulator with XRE-family HTH domain
MERSNLLRIAREARGLSLRCAAQLARMDAGQLSKIERGRAGMTLDSFLRLSRVLGLKDVAKALAPFVQDQAP